MTDRIVIFYGSKKDFEELVATETSKEQVTIPFMETILDKGIMPSEKVLDFPVDCNTLTGSVNL